ncbi:MAG TPA: thioredoxin [Myxococcota bacterium]|nr:thioredoxin [Myxococcota bacterium]
MATIPVTRDSIEALIQNSPLVVLDFWAAWCAPCRAFAPVFERASKEHTDFVFGKVDTEDQQELAAMFGISAIPTLVVFRDGIGVYQESGSIPERALEQLLEQVRRLDMDEVRKEIEAQKDAPDEVPWELRED